MSSSTVQKDRLNEAVTEAFATEGFTYEEDGDRNLNALREAIFAEVIQVQVEKRSQRASKALLKTRLVDTLFPNVVKPDHWADEDDPELAEAVYKEVSKIVWKQTEINGKVQRRVGEQNDGQVLCRTHITDDQLDACYVTHDRGCIIADITTPFADSWNRKASFQAGVMRMLVERQPDNGKAYLREFKTGMRIALESGVSQVQLTLDAVSNGDGPDETDEVTEDE